MIPGFFNIVHTENPGAAFGFMADLDFPWRRALLVAVSVAVMAIIGGLLFRLKSNSVLQTGLALVLGGALGNAWDRLVRGMVTDFLQFFFGSYEFPSFNVADSAISIGAVLLLIDLWRTKKQAGIKPVCLHQHASFSGPVAGALPSLFAGRNPHASEYRARRTELKKSLDGVMVLFGANEPDDLRIPYLQETNFLYLSGWKEPGAVMMLTKNEEILFVPERSRTTETFFGHHVAPGDPDAGERTGFEKVMSYSAVESEFTRLLAYLRTRCMRCMVIRMLSKLRTLAPFHGNFCFSEARRSRVYES